MRSLVRHMRPMATWSDLVLPGAQLDALREIIAHVRRLAPLREHHGPPRCVSTRGGFLVLFAGRNGTGKTLAAEVLAGELGLDLYRIDVSQVVSKYIGETEKDLRQVFEAAEESGAILFFDEADALFGKRTEVRNSHDRYANTEVAFVLRCMEEYRGLAILSTNRRESIDGAFLRRMAWVVEFPVPGPLPRSD